VARLFRSATRVQIHLDDGSPLKKVRSVPDHSGVSFLSPTAFGVR
jgi:hypothetical protein